MNTRSTFWRSCLCSTLALALLAGSLAPGAAAQRRKRKPVVVSFGQPNIWSLEQAHYLLARMHMTNFDLKAKELAEDSLDPNAVNGTRINILKQLFEAGVSFDQGVGFQNELITRNARFNSDRRLQLTSDRDARQAESLSLTRELAQLQRERALMNSDASATKEDKERKDAEITEADANLKAVQKQIDFDTNELSTLGAQPSGTPLSASVPTTQFDKSRLPDALLDKLGADKLLDLAKDPKLSASTILDNHIQMQYEIIAKQLTLLRDEVGPGERLVFLELPQSIYTTPGAGDEKMAQAWWHVNGYTRTDPLVRLLLELFEVEQKWQKIQEVPAFNSFLTPKTPAGSACDLYLATVTARKEMEKAKLDWQKEQSDREKKKWAEKKKPQDAQQAAQAKPKQSPTPAPAQTPPPTLPEEFNAVTIKTADKNPVFLETFQEFQCDYESARERLIQQLYREARTDFARAQQGGARDTSEMVDAIRKVIGVKPEAAVSGDKEGARRNTSVDARGTAPRDARLTQSVSQQTESSRHTQILNIKDELLKILSKDSPLDASAVSNFKTKYNITDGSEFEKGIEFIRLDEHADDGETAANVERRAVRTVDIIPRQSSLNVNDLRDTVKAVGIFGAFKFLFGLGAQTSFQRQREQFEQFLHQELYASGFGKGDRDFGWTFGALPGTKRVAPGVRTTYAVLVVPDDAESLVLSARGCYFPRKGEQPLDYDNTADSHWDDTRHNCGDEQTYIIPVPGGGDAANFWVTNIDYQPVEKGGRATVSVRGQNFSSQIGVLVNGAPLTPSVGLAQPLLGVTHKNSPAPPCDKRACGELERIDPRQIVFSFSLPKDADGKDVEGTPTITLVAPGKAVDLNWIELTVNSTRHVQLKDREFMFGSGPSDPKLGITDFKVFVADPKSGDAVGLLRGVKFDSGKDTIFVNGDEVPKSDVTHGSSNFYRIKFRLPPGENLIVTVVQKSEDGKTAVAEKSFANPRALKINKVTVLSYEPADKKSKGVLIIKIEGVGFDPKPDLSVEGADDAPRSRILDSSSTEAIVKLVNPEPSVVVTLTNSAGDSDKTVVVRQPAGDKLSTTEK